MVTPPSCDHIFDFDAAVGLALDYQAEHPETLVLVTGDHETGGISLTYDADREIVMQYASGGHTGALLPLFAAGPGAERFGGIIRNDRVGLILMEIVREEG
jgi:alkaline phosphatase